MPRKLTYEERVSLFWSNVNKDGPMQPHMDTPCWLWMRPLNNRGYGSFLGSSAHRYSLALAVGNALPKGIDAAHKCDNRQCVRPDHLFRATRKENMLDCRTKGRSPSGDRNGSRKHPECLPHGDNHWSARHPEKRLRGEAHPQARLTQDDVREIRNLADIGMFQKDIGALFEVSRENVGSIVRRSTWGHVQ